MSLLDLIYRKKLTSNESSQQGRLLHAVNGAATILLTADEKRITGALRDGMELMALCMDVDRIYIWRNEMIDGVLHYIQQFEWLNAIGMSKCTVVSKTGFAYAESIPPWEGKFLKEECVNGPVSGLSRIERERLEPFGILSILVIPIYLQERFWGFVSFDDCHQERVFTKEEMDILRSGSLMLASALNRVDALARIREADERTRLMLDATPLCCSMWNQDFQMIDCNEEAVKLFDMKDKQEYLDRFFELSPKYQLDGQLSSAKTVKLIREAFDRGGRVYEWQHHKLDGTLIPSEITLVRVRHGDGYIVIGYTRDLREYKKMMREIEYQGALLRMVNNVATVLLQSEIDEFESALWRGMGMMAEAVDVDRVYIWKNLVKDGKLYCTQLYEWAGGPKPQQVRRYAAEIPYGEGVPGWEKRLTSGLCVNGPVRDMAPGERARLSRQGIMSILVAPVFLQDQFWGFVRFDDCRRERVFSGDEESILRSGGLLIANALLRNEMTRDIRATASKLEAVIANYAGVIWSVDQNNVITLFNGLGLKALGVTPAYYEGRSLDDARQDELLSDIAHYVRKTCAEGPQDWVSEVNGRMYRTHTMPIYAGGGEAFGVMGSMDDVTETVRLQKELEDAAKEARAASRAKSNFLSNMSHEIRTPISAVIGMTSIGKATPDVDRKNYAFGNIEDASNHLLGVINDILDMSKIEANKFELLPEEFNFEKLLQKVVNVINFRVDEKKQRFTVYLDKSIPRTLVCDDQRLAQVITNLLSNAVKFTPELGEIRLDASLLKEENGVCTISIKVSDTGIGISAEQQSRLFSSFEQAESSTTRQFGGTGLGLAISKHIVELMGGSIWIESETGKGSLFAFTIQAGRGAQDGNEEYAGGTGFEDVRALAVVAGEEAGKFFADIGARFGIVCDIATNGGEAVELIESKGPYGVVFIDWNAPGLNAVDLTREIKIRAADTPIIFVISTAEWNRIEEAAKAAGADGFISKPLFPSTIADCVGRYTGAKEGSLSFSDIAPDMGESLGGYRVMLAEDVAVNREIVLALLEPTELGIDCAENGAEAVRMFAAAPELYDMILMDVQMPEMDGLEATRRIRALDVPRAGVVPIIAMTASVFREDIENCLEAGMNDHIGKPLDFNKLLSMIRQYIRT